MKNKLLVGIRTNTFNSRSLFLASYYQSKGLDVVFVVDETKLQVSTGSFEKVSFDKARLDQLGLFQSHSKIGWLCGDYFYYAMALDRPNYDGYWLIEDDAFACSANIDLILMKPLIEGIDFLAHHLAEANGKFLTGWATSMKNALDSKDPLLKCLFCITYLSRALVLECLKWRKIVSQKYISNEIDKHEFPFPNDESHVANIPSRENYKFRALKDVYPDMCNDFHYTSHGLIENIDPSRPELYEGFYHPIRITNQDLNELESRLTIKQKQQCPTLMDDVAEYVALLETRAREIKIKYNE